MDSREDYYLKGLNNPGSNPLIVENKPERLNLSYRAKAINLVH
jgi:hypothetical protein